MFSQLLSESLSIFILKIWFRLKNVFVDWFFIESYAQNPFMTESPEEIYIAKNINRDILFGVVSQVRISSIELASELLNTNLTFDYC